MVDGTDDLLSRALRLPPLERVRLAHELLESVEGDESLSPAWRAEIQQRVQETLAGEAGPAEDWRVVLERIRERGAS